MGGACGKNKAKQPKRADPTELEEKTRKEAEEKAAAEAAAREARERAKAEAAAAAEAEAAAARAQEEKERAEAEAAAAAAAAAEAAAAEEQARLTREEEARREEEERRRAEEEKARRAAEQQIAVEEKAHGESAVAAEACDDEQAHPQDAEKHGPVAEDVASEATMETSRTVHKVSEPEYGAAHGARKARTVTPCDMTAVDETSMYVSKRCGCDIGGEHDENKCLICQSIDLSDAPLLN